MAPMPATPATAHNLRVALLPGRRKLACGLGLGHCRGMRNDVETVTVRAGCKVNLHLEITGILENGYHSLRTLFYPLEEPHDTLVLRFGAEGAGFRLRAGDPTLETDSNTVARAWRAWCMRAGRWPGLDVVLEKGSPMGAGLGGGSADAAVVLRELDARAGDAALGRSVLMELAAGIGADVPFFLLDGPAWAEGIGEKLTPVDMDLGGMTLVLVCPPEHVSSAWAYSAWDQTRGEMARAPENSKGFLTYGGREFRNSPRSRIVLFNSFEDVVFAKHPNLLRHKEKLLSLGAAGAVMSGSGASLLALYRDPGLARRTLEEFGREGIAAFLHTL